MSKFPKGKIGDLLTLQRGFDITKKFQADGPYPVVSSGGISSYHDEYMVKGPGVVIGRKGTLGTAFYLQDDYWPHDTTLWVKDFKGNDPKFIYYFLKKLPLENLDSGSANPTLNRNFVHQVETQIIPVDVQAKIAAVLSALDAKIDCNNRINAELEAMAKTLYDYWFVQFDFPDTNGKPYKSSGGKMVWNKELKREIPAGWESKALAKITDVSNEQLNPMNDPEKEFKHYSIPVFDTNGSFAVEKGADIKSNKFIINKLDVLVSKLNPWFNRVVYATDDSDLISSTEFVVWRTTSENMKNYMFMVARDPSFIAYCTKSATGTSNSHKRVNPAVMMKHLIPFHQKTAETFGSVLDSTIKMYAKNRVENNNLSSLRDWLLPMLMNGQVRVG